MPTFVQQALANKPMTVFATGRQVRAFVSAMDLARFVCDYWDDALDSGRHIFNIGNPDNRIPVEDLAARIKELLGSSSSIIHVDAQAIHGPMYIEAESFEKIPVLEAALAIDWKPERGLDDLILETAEYYRGRQDKRGANAPL